MLKKLVAVSAAFMLFACSSDSDDSSTPTNSSTGGEVSSSSQVPTEEVLVANLTGTSKLFGTYSYGYTLKEGAPEDLSQFWNIALMEDGESVCTIATSGKALDATCELKDKKLEVPSILQNTLTNQYADLNYKIDGFKLVASFNDAIGLNEYHLSAVGDQAALGLNISDGDDKNIGDLGISELDGIVSFTYTYKGGAHEFRVVSLVDDDFWYANVPGSSEVTVAEINISDFKGMGSYAEVAEEDVVITPETPFDILKAAKFLWAVEYSEDVSANNTGSLLIKTFNAKVKE